MGSVTVLCDHCRDDAEVAFCQKHFDAELQKSFAEGEEEGFEAGKQKGAEDANN